jgi:hypothetical protein
MLTRSNQNRCSARAGAVLIWVVLSLAVIVGIVALNLDGGRMMEERRRAQAAADAAALAAAADLYANYWTYQGKDTKGTAKAAAEKAALANGFPASAVTVNMPPTKGTFKGQGRHVEVLINTELDAGFIKIFTKDELPVEARAVALGEPMRIGMILLRPNGADSFLNKSLAFTLVGAPLIVNSNDAAAYNQASLGVVVASRFDIAGNYINPGGAIILGKIRTGQRPVPDPLAFLPIPDSSAAVVRSSKPLVINSLLPTVLNPGVYQGGIRIEGLSVVTMLPGVYIMEGGGFQVEGAATVAAVEVMVYNTTSATYAEGPITVKSIGKVAMAAPLSGTYQGLNFFQNRAMTQPISLQGFGLAAITGVVYAARGPVRLTGSAAVGLDILGGAYVVDSMTVEGAGAINVDLGLNPPRIPDVRLVE